MIAATLSFAVATSCGREATDSQVTPQPPRDNEKKEPTQSVETPPTSEPATQRTAELPLIIQIDEGVISSQGFFRARIKEWQSGPQVTQNESTRNAFSIEFATKTGHKPTSLDSIQVTPFMKIHGHGVPRAYLPVWNVEDHLVHITQLGFIMAGPWQIIVRARVNGIEDSIEIPIEVP